MIVRRVAENDIKAWDSYIHSHRDASPYHLFGWMQAVRSAYGFKDYSLVAEKNGKIVGIFPLVALKKPFHKPDLVSLPYCDVGSILSDSEEIGHDLLEEALIIAKKIKAPSIDMREAAVSQRNRFFSENTTVNKVRMLLDLPDSSEELWSSFKSKLRSQIKKAEKNGLRFEINNKRVASFYKVFSQNMRDLGSPVHSKKMIDEIVTHFGDKATLGLVFNGDTPVGAGITLRVGNKVSIPWASTLRSQNKLNPNMLLYWGLLEFATDNGCTQFDFGRSTPGEGTYRFKSQWGAKPQPLIWGEVLLKDKKVNSQIGQGKLKKGIVSVWQRLPLPVATFCGSQIRKYISL